MGGEACEKDGEDLKFCQDHGNAIQKYKSGAANPQVSAPANDSEKTHSLRSFSCVLTGFQIMATGEFAQPLTNPQDASVKVMAVGR
jgi:hypothetical protein